MNAIQLFTKHAPNKTFLAVVLGAFSGVLYAMLIPLVMKALSSDTSQLAVENKIVEVLGLEIAYSNFAGVFLTFCILILILNSFSQVILARVSMDVRFILRKNLYRRIQKAPISSVESVGPSRLLQALSNDVSAIVAGAQLLPNILTNVVTMLGMLGYLFYVDTNIFFYIVQVVIFGVITYQIPIIIGANSFFKARNHEDLLQEGFKGLVEGAKELKLSLEKTQVYEDEILIKQEKIVRGLQKRGFTAFNLASNYGNLLSFFAIGGLSFILLNYYVLTNAQITVAIMTLLYLSAPIGFLLNVIPQLSRTKIAINKIDKLYSELKVESVSDDYHPIKNWNSIQLRNIKFKYDEPFPSFVKPNSYGFIASLFKSKKIKTLVKSADQIKTFEVGPVDVEIKRGEITFITGGNGSGKSTLCKVISLHYIHTDGQITYDHDNIIDKNNITNFRHEINCIYSDYYLFDKALNQKSISADYEEQIHQYLKAFNLEGKVEYKDGNFSTLKLSDGQRRRLALVVSLVENKSLYVFDEWAADQDPEFKAIFYNEILSELKNKNKAVVVISHDDRYFHVADQLLHMESGQLRTTQRKRIDHDES